jgi:hypothetical protein
MTASRRRTAALGLGLWLATAALPAAAEVQLPAGNGVKAGGTLSNELRIGRLTTSADGQKARTELRANTIERTAAGGDITVTTDIDELILRAEGRSAKSEMAVGVVRDVTTGGDLTNSVMIGSSTNIAIGAGARACTELGTLGVGACR